VGRILGHSEAGYDARSTTVNPTPAAMHTTLLLLLLAPLSQDTDTAEDGQGIRIGHSAHGEAFDEGPRQRPWLMEDVGTSHFPITTSVPEVQEWFDQGNTLLHNFWFYEAERQFRWCLKLDPDCAMAYWGLARCTGRSNGGERGLAFLAEAVKRKDTVTDRERMYIEAWERAYAPELSGAIELMDEEDRNPFEALAAELEMIVVAYPDDIEAKALHMLYSLYSGSRVGLEYLAQAIFAEEPLHPGGHHYRIHNWDGPEGAEALSSCEIYGELASYVGHANHMPGHIYSGIGMWHEAGIWMDRATRVEKDYMRERMIFPFNHWNHAHNRNYLSYIQEQLGMAHAAQDGARQLLAAPYDPKYNDPDGGYSVYRQGMAALLRNLVKFERWEDILADGMIPWRETDVDTQWRSYVEALAHIELGHEREAIDSMIALQEFENEDKRGRFLDRMLLELRGTFALSKGELLEGAALLDEAARAQLEGFHGENDPPSYPRVLANVLGEAYLTSGASELAAASFERTLEDVGNDGFALSGLVEAYTELGETDKAKHAFARLSHVWSGCDPDLRWWTRAAAHGYEVEPLDLSPKAQREYSGMDLTAFGPGTWIPYAAPDLQVIDTDENYVSLYDFRGKNVVVVFYIGEECAHCVDQLIAIEERMADFRHRDVEVLAISHDTPEDNRKSLKMGELEIRLLSDPDNSNAIAWNSYDEFEEIELHSTNFIDREGRVRWARTGGDPFMDLDFLLEEIDRANGDSGPRVSAVEAGATTADGAR